jgi:hypothetical protein
MTPFRYQDYLAVGRLSGFLGRESDYVVVRSWYVPLSKVGQAPPHADLPSVPTSKPIAPVVWGEGCGSGQRNAAAENFKAERS